MTRAPKRKIEIEIDADTAGLLDVLTHSAMAPGDVAGVVRHLVHSAADGVRRPGSWERSWVQLAFGEIDADAIEAHPTVPYYVRPRGGTR